MALKFMEVIHLANQRQMGEYHLFSTMYVSTWRSLMAAKAVAKLNGYSVYNSVGTRIYGPATELVYEMPCEHGVNDIVVFPDGRWVFYTDYNEIKYPGPCEFLKSGSAAWLILIGELNNPDNY